MSQRTHDPRQIDPDDPRHGTHAGYMTGCRCDDCCEGHYRANKERWIYRERNGSCRVEFERWSAVVDQWLTDGYTMWALSRAAGMGSRTDLAGIYKRQAPINRATYAALKRVTEDDIDDAAMIPSALSLKRVFSLMAIGHKLDDMPINKNGRWRQYGRIQAGTARIIRDHYRAHSHLVGTSKQTAARARNNGHVPPMAWDDPDTLTWPGGIEWTPAAAKSVSDQVAIQRRMTGDRSVRLTRSERAELAQQWFDSGRPMNDCERITGINGWRELRKLAKKEVA